MLRIRKSCWHKAPSTWPPNTLIIQMSFITYGSPLNMEYFFEYNIQGKLLGTSEVPLMRVPSFHMNGRFHYEFNQWGPPFMLEEGARIYGTPGIHINFPLLRSPLELFYLQQNFNCNGVFKPFLNNGNIVLLRVIMLIILIYS